jgi:5'-deoxynucleotidase YfbR-like HD superfamily hydrolase
MPEDVAQHSYFVALLCKIFVAEYNKFCENYLVYCEKSEVGKYHIDMGEVLEKALCHDWDETFTSDIPYVVKHITPEVNHQLSLNLDERMRKVIDGCSDAIKDIYSQCTNCKDGVAGAVVAICDMLELALYCYEECTLGNKAIEPILRNCIFYLDNMEQDLGYVLWKSHSTVLSLSRVAPTINGLYAMIKEYNFSSDNLYIDIESHEQT